MLILVEGNDLTGKTTLAKKIAEVTKLKYKHLGPPGDTPTMAHHSAYIGEWCVEPLGMVLDRGHWSGAVYGWAGFNPNNVFPKGGFAALELIFRELGGVVVYCKASSSEIFSRWGRGEDLIEKSDVDNLNTLFDKVRGISSAPVVQYRIGRDDMYKTIAKVVQLAAERSTK